MWNGNFEGADFGKVFESKNLKYKQILQEVFDEDQKRYKY
jgi:hypothetical protein